MLLHEEISFFSNSCQFWLLGLFDCVCLVIYLRHCFEDCREVASSNMLNLMELVHAAEVFLGLWLRDCSLRAIQFVFGPILLLTVDVAVISFLAPSALQQFDVHLPASAAGLGEWFGSLHFLNLMMISIEISTIQQSKLRVNYLERYNQDKLSFSFKTMGPCTSSDAPKHLLMQSICLPTC